MHMMAKLFTGIKIDSYLNPAIAGPLSKVEFGKEVAITSAA
jgi:hypothetical protein